MSFSQMMELLQIKEKGRIVICNAGDFYVAIGKDAILLNKILGLKVTCFKTEVCKVGFPIQSLEKYTELLIKSRYSYIIFYFDKNKRELSIVESCKGKRLNEETEQKLNCYKCKHNGRYYKKEDMYIEAVKKLYEGGLYKEEVNEDV